MTYSSDHSDRFPGPSKVIRPGSPRGSATLSGRSGGAKATSAGWACRGGPIRLLGGRIAVTYAR
eukprot:11831015-Alexandrium_andersonii.AAC.1